MATGRRWNPFSYCWGKSSDDCLQELKWTSIQKPYLHFHLPAHDIRHQGNPISFADHFQLSSNSTRSHPLTIRTASSSTNT